MTHTNAIRCDNTSCVNQVGGNVYSMLTRPAVQLPEHWWLLAKGEPGLAPWHFCSDGCLFQWLVTKNRPEPQEPRAGEAHA